MNPDWLLAALALIQVAGIGFLWRIQRDQAQLVERLKDWVHQEYMPRELAEALYMRRPGTQDLAVAKVHRVNRVNS